jgi:hypothetical protein
MIGGIKMVMQIKNIDELPAAVSVWPGLGQALGISRATAFALVKEPGFPAIRVGKKRIIIPKDRLMDWISEKAKQPLDN